MASAITKLAASVFVWQRVNQVVFLLRNILVAWVILPADQGIFATAANLVVYLGAISSLEFRTAFFSQKNLSENQLRTQWTMETSAAILSLLIGAICFQWIEATRSNMIAWATLFLLVVILLEASYSTHLYHLEKDLQYGWLTRLQTFWNIISLVVTLILGSLGWGWKALIVDRILQSGGRGLAVAIRYRWKPRFQFDWESFRWYRSFIGVLFLNGLLCKVIFAYDVFVVAKYLGETATGIYNMAMRWALIPMELGAGFLAVFALSYYSSRKIEGMNELRAAYEEITFHIVRCTVLISVLMALFMNEFFHLFYKPQWWDAAPLFIALLPYALARPLYQNVCQALQAAKRLWSIFWIDAVMAVAALIILHHMASRGTLAVALSTGSIVMGGYVLLETTLWFKTKHNLILTHGAPLVIGLAAWIPATLLTDFHEGLTIRYLSIKIGIGTIYALLAIWEWNRNRHQFHHSNP